MAAHDVDADGWHKSRASAASNCVEVRFAGERVLVRNTKNRQGALLTFTHGEWHAFLTGVRLGEFDVPDVRSPE